MDAWCTKQHGSVSYNRCRLPRNQKLILFKSGLTQACLKSPHTREYVSGEVLSYIKKWIPAQKVGVLAGNSVHADRGFLINEMPEVVDWLHYRYSI